MATPRLVTGNYTARSTLLERRHLVQAYTWHGVPLTTALTRLTLGFHARLERLWEWETLMPKVTPLPQKSHLAIHCTSYLHAKSKVCLCRRLDMIPEFDEKSKCFFRKNRNFIFLLLLRNAFVIMAVLHAKGTVCYVGNIQCSADQTC